MIEDANAAEMAAAGGPLPPLVAEDYSCVDCGLSYSQITIVRAQRVIEEFPAAVRHAVLSLPLQTLRQRPDARAWSALEYVCHLRDVYVTSTIRLHRTRTENQPVLEPMLNDLRARRFRYNERDLAATLDELAAAVVGFCEETTRTHRSDWDRVATRLPGEQRTARWLIRQAMHEGVHHLNDIRMIGAAVMKTN
ncbi:MAG: DinB family protein [Nakamurella sp.]